MKSNDITYEPNYKGFSIEARPGIGLRTEILDVLEDLLHDMANRFSAIAAVMLDIRVPPGEVCSEDNRAIKRFSSAFAEYLQRQSIASHHVWVQKHPECSADPHYVAVLLADARYGENVDLHLAQANLLWAQQIGSAQRKGLIHYCGLEGASRAAPVLMLYWGGPGLQRDFRSAFSALSRIAHVETPAHAEDDALAFGTSRPW
jgi:hypothetical protein